MRIIRQPVHERPKVHRDHTGQRLRPRHWLAKVNGTPMIATGIGDHGKATLYVDEELPEPVLDYICRTYGFETVVVYVEVER